MEVTFSMNSDDICHIFGHMLLEGVKADLSEWTDVLFTIVSLPFPPETFDIALPVLNGVRESGEFSFVILGCYDAIFAESSRHPVGYGWNG